MRKIEKYIDWFNTYVNSFVEEFPDLKENLLIKADHCKKVHQEIKLIAENLELSDEDMFIAELIGLFHDIGRFRQYVKYKTFSDSKSQNHADLGVEVLNEYEVLKELSEIERELVLKAILNHSRAEIMPDSNERELFFSKLIRDADKLDIWRLITEYYMVKDSQENKTLVLDLPDTKEITDVVYQAIINRQIVLKETMKTVNDFKLMQIGWLFDLNFDHSIVRLYEKGYLKRIFDSLPKDEKITNLKLIVEDYFTDHIETFRYR